MLDVVAAAFGRADEARLVERVWASGEYLPSLDLVAEDEGAIVGHVLHSRGEVDGRAVAALGPLSVTPERQRQGVGTALMDEALGRADRAGYPLVALLGHPTYYPRFGFVPAATLGIEPSFPVLVDGAFMARPLSAYDPSFTGQLRYGPAFDP